MRLAHQLFLGVSLLFLAALTGALAVSFLLTRQYVTTQLASHAEDAAISLSLTLAGPLQSGDGVHATTVVKAMFDRGYYQEIRVLDARGAELVRRELPANLEGVPVWFTSAFSIDMPSGESLISSGWRQLGRVIVKSHPGHAYQKLWQISGALLLLFSCTFVLSALFLWFVLRTILAPLRDIEQQAADIGRRVFREITRLPRVRELAAVVGALNRMAVKLRQSFEEQAALIEHTRREAREDGVTGLPNRREFDDRASHLLRAETDYPHGLVLLVELARFRNINEHHGFERADALLRLTADTLRRAAGPQAMVSRLAGASFVLLIPGLSDDEVAIWAEGVRAALARVAAVEPELQTHGYALGGVRFDRERGLGSLLGAADTALAAARAGGPNHLAWHTEPVDKGRGARDWQRLLTRALADPARLRLLGQPMLRLADGQRHAMEITTQLLDEDGTPLAAGLFAPVAERLGLAIRLDEAVITRCLTLDLSERLAINLSDPSVASPVFHAWLDEVLESNPDKASRLVFEVDELAAVTHAAMVQLLGGLLRARGAAIALDRFAARHGAFGYLEALEPAYVKLDGSVVRDLDKRDDNRFFVRSLVSITAVLEIPVIAQWVEREEEWNSLRRLGVFSAQGYYAGRPEAV